MGSWKMLEQIIDKIGKGQKFDKQVGITYLSTLLGRTFDETVVACRNFEKASGVNSLFEIVYCPIGEDIDGKSVSDCDSGGIQDSDIEIMEQITGEKLKIADEGDLSIYGIGPSSKRKVLVDKIIIQPKSSNLPIR